jgi:hypothetical protein
MVHFDVDNMFLHHRLRGWIGYTLVLGDLGRVLQR